MEKVEYKKFKILDVDELLKMAKKARRYIYQNPGLLRSWQFEDIKILKLEKSLLDLTDFSHFTKKIMEWCEENLHEIKFSLSDEGNYKIHFLNEWRLIWAPPLEKSPITWWKLIALIEIVDRHFPLHSPHLEKKNSLDQLLNDLPWPMALFDHQHQLVIQNRGFSQLNLLLSDCLHWTDGHKITFNDELFELVRKEVPTGLVIYFKPLKGPALENSHELGIVTSSLAHELNNPLAGIIATLDLLELLAPPESIKVKDYQEMKETCWRCKELVELFLGFSRTTPQRELSRQVTFTSLIQHSQDLLRFRLFELNIILDVENKSTEHLVAQYNPSVLTMIFYLIWSDFLTQFGHYLLVASELEASERKLSLRVEEKISSFEIHIEGNFEVKWNDNPLIKSLLEYDGIQLTKVSAKQFIFSWKLPL